MPATMLKAAIAGAALAPASAGFGYWRRIAKKSSNPDYRCFQAVGDGFHSVAIYDSGYVDIGVAVTDTLVAGVSEHNYHLHVGWDRDTEQCGPEFTGGHYDPTRACGGASDALCLNDAGDRVKGFAYDGADVPATAKCGTAPWLQDNCEVGDLSGRAGKVPVAGATVTSYYFPNFAKDFQENNELETDDDGARIREPAEWSSLVMHCNTEGCSARVGCAKYEEVSCYKVAPTFDELYGARPGRRALRGN